MTEDVDRFVVSWKLMPIPRGLLYLSPPGEPNRERCGVVSAPRVSLSGLEPDYGFGGSVWRLQALKMGSSVEISTISPRGSFQRYGRDTGRTLQVVSSQMTVCGHHKSPPPRGTRVECAVGKRPPSDRCFDVENADGFLRH